MFVSLILVIDLLFKKNMIDFRETGRERGRGERERNIDLLFRFFMYSLGDS